MRKLLANQPAIAAHNDHRSSDAPRGQRLREALDAWRDAPARLTRDCVTLIEGLLAGRNELASIPDVQVLRSELRSLNLDPDR